MVLPQLLTIGMALLLPAGAGTPLQPLRTGPLPGTGVRLAGTTGPLLPFRLFLTPGPRELRFSPRLLALSGRRVEAYGYVADLEEPPVGGLLLAPIPLKVDEEGAGTGDLPPSSLWVPIPGSPAPLSGVAAGPVRVVGRLLLTPAQDPGEHVWTLRLVPSSPQDVAAARRLAKAGPTQRRTVAGVSTQAGQAGAPASRRAARPK
ncbi:MAG TPA: hypothetical protein VGN26_19710 [Armatimonadota bacterium]